MESEFGLDSYRLLRFVHELRLSGIGPPRLLLATFLQGRFISKGHEKARVYEWDDEAYRSNKSVSFPSSAGILPVR